MTPHTSPWREILPLHSLPSHVDGPSWLRRLAIGFPNAASSSSATFRLWKSELEGWNRLLGPQPPFGRRISRTGKLEVRDVLGKMSFRKIEMEHLMPGPGPSSVREDKFN